MKPSAEKILSVLAELYAKQKGVKIKYIVETKEKEKCGVSKNLESQY